MSASLRLFGSECRSEAVHLAEHGGSRLRVQLAGLCQVGLPEIEVLRFEQRSGRLPDRPGQNRRVHQYEFPFVHEVPNRLHHFVPNAHDRRLPRRS